MNRMLGIADLPADDEDLRARKHAVVGSAYGVLAASIAWQVIFNTVYPERAIFLLSFAYIGVQIANLGVLAWTKRVDRAAIVVLLAGLVAVVYGHVLLGGFGGTAGSSVWLIIVPIAAIVIIGPAQAGIWLAAGLLGIATVLAVELAGVAPAAQLPPTLNATVTAFNLVGAMVVSSLTVRYVMHQLQAARARIDALLTNAIPAPIAARLKQGEQRIADAYAETTVLFADLVGFTAYASRTDPERVVDRLDSLFRAFDRHAEACGMVKIKTIGDAYMAVAGVPEPAHDGQHAERAMELALAMRQEAPEGQLRIGLASGPLVGGVIGQERISFDLWGDTVNLASRMESTGVAGRIQVAESTFGLLKDRYRFSPRQIEAKGMGSLIAYLLEG